MHKYILGLCFLLVAPPGLAQKWNTDDQRSSERSAMLKTLDRGKEMKGSGGSYQLLPQLGAVALSGAAETPDQAVARIGENGAQVVETKGRLVLFRSAKVRPASVGIAGSASVYPTVVNASTGALGVLTGMLVVKPRSMADADAIAKSFGLEKAKVYPQLRTVFYRARPGVDIADAAAALQADARVENAYPEIIEHVRVPK